MSKFGELMDIITRNKNKDKKPFSIKMMQNETSMLQEDERDNDDIQLEVSGTDSTKAPLVAAANEELDPDLIDTLYSQAKWRNIPLRGENASSWDSDY